MKILFVGFSTIDTILGQQYFDGAARVDARKLAYILGPRALVDPNWVSQKKGKDTGYVQEKSGKTYSFTPLLVEKVVDTTGAGDCFALGFLVSWYQGYSPGQALYQACKLSAQNVQTLGAVVKNQEA